jgi:hypothetical protein
MNIRNFSTRAGVIFVLSAAANVLAAASGASPDGIYQLQSQIPAFRAQASVLRPIQSF